MADEITLQEGNFVTWRRIKKNSGLDVSQSLKKILEREDQYLYVARRTFTNLSLGVPNLHRVVSNLNNEILPKKADISLLKISICFLA